jgi:hypothetical protein
MELTVPAAPREARGRDKTMINHPNRSNGSTHEVSFVANGVTVGAEYRQRSKSGHLAVYLDGVQVVDLDWIDYQPSYFTDEGLERFARLEIATIAQFNADPSNFGEGEAPDPKVVELTKMLGF